MQRHPHILNSNNAILLIVDVQEAFRKFIPDIAQLTKSINMLADGAELLDVPVIVTEQYPKGLGHTIDEIASSVGQHEIFEKSCFSCCGSDGFMSALSRSGRTQIIVTGIEAHVCVNQTVHDLLANGYQTHLVIDAISSRLPSNKEIGVKKMLTAGAVASGVELALLKCLLRLALIHSKRSRSLSNDRCRCLE